MSGSPLVYPRFWREVLADFLYNKGLLLAGAIAYNTLLSLVPLVAVLLVVASRFFDQGLLLSIMTTELEFILPGRSGTFASDFSSVIEDRYLVGGIGAVVLIFFSSMTFRTLEDALAIIFARPPDRRRALVSAFLPFVFILILTGGLLAITGLSVTLVTYSTHSTSALAEHLASAQANALLLYFGGLLGLAITLAAIYWLMPAMPVRPHRALLGGLIATALWEATRRVLVYYFSNISMVNSLYGSAAAIIIILLCMEIGAIILLLGAQTIANLERHERGLTTFSRGG
jgi:YihY family inner membrane protein